MPEADERPEDGGLIVAVFDTKYVALRTVEELRSADFHDYWLGIVTGETPNGHTTIAADGVPGEELLLHRTLIAHGASEEHAHRFDSILPPGTAIMTLALQNKLDRAIHIIEVSGGHIEDF